MQIGTRTTEDVAQHAHWALIEASENVYRIGNVTRPDGVRREGDADAE